MANASQNSIFLGKIQYLLTYSILSTSAIVNNFTAKIYNDLVKKF